MGIGLVGGEIPLPLLDAPSFTDDALHYGCDVVTFVQNDDGVFPYARKVGLLKT